MNKNALLNIFLLVHLTFGKPLAEMKQLSRPDFIQNGLNGKQLRNKRYASAPDARFLNAFKFHPDTPVAYWPPIPVASQGHSYQYQQPEWQSRAIRSPFFGYPDVFGPLANPLPPIGSKCKSYEFLGYQSVWECQKRESYALLDYGQTFSGAPKVTEKKNNKEKYSGYSQAPSKVYRSLLMDNLTQGKSKKNTKCRIKRYLGMTNEDCKKRENFGALSYDQEFPEEPRTTTTEKTTTKCGDIDCVKKENFGALAYDQEFPTNVEETTQKYGSTEGKNLHQDTEVDGFQPWDSDEEKTEPPGFRTLNIDANEAETVTTINEVTDGAINQQAGESTEEHAEDYNY